MLEDSIKATEEAALDAAETDSVVTGTSFTGNPDGRSQVHGVRRWVTGSWGQMVGHGFMGSDGRSQVHGVRW